VGISDSEPPDDVELEIVFLPAGERHGLGGESQNESESRPPELWRTVGLAALVTTVLLLVGIALLGDRGSGPPDRQVTASNDLVLPRAAEPFSLELSPYGREVVGPILVSPNSVGFGGPQLSSISGDPVWTIADGVVTARFDLPAGAPMALSEVGLVVQTPEGGLTVAPLPTGEAQRVELNASTQYFLVGGQPEPVIWSFEYRSLRGPIEVSRVAYADQRPEVTSYRIETSAQIAVATNDGIVLRLESGAIAYWSPADGVQTLTSASPATLALGASDNLIAVAGPDETQLRIVDVGADVVVLDVQTSGPVLAACFSPEESFVAVQLGSVRPNPGSGLAIYQLDRQRADTNGQEPFEFGRGEAIFDVAWLSDQELIFATRTELRALEVGATNDRLVASLAGASQWFVSTGRC